MVDRPARGRLIVESVPIVVARVAGVVVVVLVRLVGARLVVAAVAVVVRLALVVQIAQLAVVGISLVLSGPSSTDRRRSSRSAVATSRTGGLRVDPRDLVWTLLYLLGSDLTTVTAYCAGAPPQLTTDPRLKSARRPPS